MRHTVGRVALASAATTTALPSRAVTRSARQLPPPLPLSTVRSSPTGRASTAASAGAEEEPDGCSRTDSASSAT